MRGFQRRTSVADATRVALADVAANAAVDVELGACDGRVLAETATSDVDVPAFRRAAMDGYAVRGEDTFGATPYDPVKLALVGESMPGQASAPRVAAKECVRIMTGARVPDGADAVLPAETARETDDQVATEAPVTPGKNVGRVGEDVAKGDVLLREGRVLRPQDVGLLASIGRRTAKVRAFTRVRIVVSGDELVAPGERARGTQIVDSDSPMLAALVRRDHGVVESIRRVADELDAVRGAFADLRGVDVVVAAGGTSVGKEDFLPQVVDELGELEVHGVAMRPSSPTGIGRVGATKVFLLPGNPVSCLAAYDFFAGPRIRALAGLPTDWPYRRTSLPLRRRIVSEIGRTDYVRVTIADGAAEPLAVSGASILSSTTRADGFVVVPPESEGAAEGERVSVFLFDSWWRE